MAAEDVTDGRLLIPAREAARLLAISPRTLWTLTKRREVACVRIGRRVLYHMQTLPELVKRKESANGKREQ